MSKKLTKIIDYIKVNLNCVPNKKINKGGLKMSVIAKGKKIITEARGLPKEVEKITYQELRPGDNFLVVREREGLPRKMHEVWQFHVLEILPGIAKVKVTFPRTGYEEVAYFEMVAIGEWFKVYFNPEKTGYFLDDNIIGIVVL